MENVGSKRSKSIFTERTEGCPKDTCESETAKSQRCGNRGAIELVGTDGQKYWLCGVHYNIGIEVGLVWKTPHRNDYWG